jgi:hypothetical protein
MEWGAPTWPPMPPELSSPPGGAGVLLVNPTNS